MKGLPVSLSECKAALKAHKNQLDPYHQLLFRWLIRRVDRLRVRLAWQQQQLIRMSGQLRTQDEALRRINEGRVGRGLSAVEIPDLEVN